jgi:hypothetical protein
MLSSTIYFFHDFLETDTKPIKDEMVHHIVSANFFSMNEINIANKIRNLNIQNGFRFHIFDSAKRLKIGEIGSDHLDPNIVKSNGNQILLTFPKLDLVYFDAYLSSLSSSKKYIYQLIEGYRYLLSSLDLLVSNQIIHNGLNLNTIVLNKERPILTNFSKSIDLTNKGFNWSQYFLLRKLDRFCPVELYLLQYQVTNNLELSMYNIETIIKQVIKDYGLDSKLDINFEYFAKYTNKTFAANLLEALKYWKTWDNYAFSMVYLEILNDFEKSDNKFISDFMKLLVSYTNLDPSKRGLSSQCLTLFEDMLHKISISDFRELISVNQTR